MAKIATKFEMSTRAAQAASIVLEKATDWGAKEHLAFLRYLALACSAEHGAQIGTKEIGGKKVAWPCDASGIPLDKITLDWAQWRDELTVGKYAECANLKKALVDNGDLATSKTDASY
jgi:hypothetical protein